jgi:hypothetical protein
MSLKPPTDGLCIGKTDLFFLPPYRTSESIEKEKQAVSLCRACPSREQCLNYALQHEVFGIWGGMTERARKAMRREMGIKVDQFRTDMIVR